MTDRQYLFATLPRRLKASIVDGILLLVLFIVNPLIVGMVSDNTLWSRIVMFAPLLLLEPFLVTYLGFTPGQYLFGIQVVRTEGHPTCPLGVSFARTYTKYLLGGFSLVYMLFGEKYQAIHDHLAKTVVVLSKRKLETSPQFAQYGEMEQVFEDAFTYPSPLKRFGVFLLWYLLVIFVVGIPIELAATRTIPRYSVTGRLPEPLQIMHDTFFSVVFFSLAVLAAKGRLPGAKRKKKIPEDETLN